MSENKLSEKLIADILTHEMQLEKDQIWILDQDRKIPNTKGLFIAVGFVDGMPYSVSKEIYYLDVGTAPNIITQMWERQTVQMQENIQINISSRDTTARDRRWEIIAALESIYSKQRQECGAVKIARIPRTVANASSSEGGSNMNKFVIVIPTLAWYKKEKMVQSGGDYYDDFTQRVDDENTIGTDTPLIEFEIDSTGVK